MCFKIAIDNTTVFMQTFVASETIIACKEQQVKILSIDTSGQQAGVAIMDEYITIGEILINAQSGPKTWHHSEILMPAIERLFALSGLELADMDYVAYTAGPGSFTGLRIGAATALGLARGINKPAVAVPTLDALAYNILRMIPCDMVDSGESNRLIVPLMDARRGQMYAAIYQTEPSGVLTRLTDYFASSIGDALERVSNLSKPLEGALCVHPQSDGMPPTVVEDGGLSIGMPPTTSIGRQLPVIFLGDGADANKDTILSHNPTAQFAPANANRQRAASVGLCAIHQLQGGSVAETQDQPSVGATAPTTHPPHPVNLIYVRDPQAVRTAKKP